MNAASKNSTLLCAVFLAGAASFGFCSHTARANESTAINSSDDPATVAFKATLRPHSLGDPHAPVKVDEYASMAQSDCGAFSNYNFTPFQGYINAGQVYFTFHDFPSGPADTMAAEVSRCLPRQQYFDFIKFAFQTQNEWAASDDYRSILKQDAAKFGLDDAGFEACVSNPAMDKGIADNLQESQERDQVESAPHFIITYERQTMLINSAVDSTCPSLADDLQNTIQRGLRLGFSPAAIHAIPATPGKNRTAK